MNLPVAYQKWLCFLFFGFNFFRVEKEKTFFLAQIETCVSADFELRTITPRPVVTKICKLPAYASLHSEIRRSDWHTEG